MIEKIYRILTENVIFSETSIFLGILIITFILYHLFDKINKRSYNLPPGPTGLPLVGYLPFIGSKPLEKLDKISEKYGNIFSFYLGQTLTVVLNDWPSAEEAFSQNGVNDRPPGIFDSLPNGVGHAGVNGKEWSTTRSFVIKTMRDVGLGRPQWETFLQEEVDEIIKEIQDHKGQPLNVRDTFSTTFTNNVMTLLFGEKISSSHPAVVYISNSVDNVAEAFTVLSGVNFLPKICYFLNQLGLYGSKKTIQKLVEFGTFVKKYIDDKVRKHESGDESFIGIYNREIKQQKEIPNTYITHKSFYGDMQALLLGGTETTRTAMVWLLLAIAENPDIQEKIHKELDTVLGKDGKVLFSERDKVPYTYGAIMECLRWKSVVPLNLLRMTNTDIKVQGYNIPEGSAIVLNQNALHNDPKYWTEPHKFKPERYLTEEGKIMSSLPKSYVPFSIGRRNCPGKAISYMELFQYFVSIMQNFVVLPPENGIKYEVVLALSYQPKNLKLRFVPREQETLKRRENIIVV